MLTDLLLNRAIKEGEIRPGSSYTLITNVLLFVNTDKSALNCEGTKNWKNTGGEADTQWYPLPDLPMSVYFAMNRLIGPPTRYHSNILTIFGILYGRVISPVHMLQFTFDFFVILLWFV